MTGTLPTDTVVDTANPALIRIQDGTVEGTNLFHSFDVFSPGSVDVKFEWDASLTIDNIFGRVIGGTASDINSLISVMETPVNLFLINPSGIIFGENARLDPGVSFYGSTASSIIFPDTEFTTVNPSSSDLLSVRTPIALQFTGSSGAITIKGTGHLLRGGSQQLVDYSVTPDPVIGLEASAGNNIALIGNGVTFEGGNVVVDGGNLNITSVRPNSNIGITGTSNFNFDYTAVSQFSDLSLSKKASIDASGGTGGSIRVYGNNITLSEGANIFAFTEASGIGETVEVNAAGTLDISGFNGSIPSGVFTKNTDPSLGGGGEVVIHADVLNISGGGQIWSGNFDSGLRGGDVSVVADQLSISGDTNVGFFGKSGIYAIAQSDNAGGDLSVTAENVELTNGAVLTTETSRTGNAGQIILNATGAISASGFSQISSSSFGSGNAGKITVNANDLSLAEASLLTAQTQDSGNAGTVNLNLANTLMLTDGSQISTSTRGDGNGGDINIAANSISLLGIAQESSAISSKVAFNNAFGDGGDINIQAQALRLLGGAQIASDTIGKGDSGNITVEVTGTTTIAGTGIRTSDPEPVSSGIASQVSEGGMGNGGVIKFRSNNLDINNGGVITGGTAGNGSSGTVTVDVANSITISGSQNNRFSAIAARTRTDQNAGNLTIEATTLQISDSGTVTVEGLNENGPSGNAGNLTINARYIRLNNNASITGSTTSGQGGNLTLSAEHIVMLFDSEIATTAGTANQPGDGGNITIAAATVTGLFNSDIASNSFQGRGGRIVITAQGIFGLEFRLVRTAENDITAISLVDPELNGEVVLNTPDLDPTQALIEIPVVESPEVVERVCTVRPGTDQQTTGQFAVSGLAVPLGPPGVSSSVSGSGMGAIAPFVGTNKPIRAALITATPTPPQTTNPLIAQGWGKNAQGQLVFTAEPTADPVQGMLVSAVRCG
ncbi:S-layer family protein [Spirulina major CS-329]|uniref:beta strand repeat-containing protein n=1 Tax=Spirulina TaxID=1154 RepID=UPI00232AF9E3|nr:S-layer family protein [Spirulina major]MDB9501642.1 S-layer family protein [Spirulina major CS-329]